MTDLEDGHGQEIRRRTGIDEDAMLHPQPHRPFSLKGPHIGAMRQDRILLLQMLDYGIEIFTKNIVTHQRILHTSLPKQQLTDLVIFIFVNDAKRSAPDSPLSRHHRRLFLAIIITVLDQNGATPVIAEQRALIGGENVRGFFETNDLYRAAHGA